MLQKKIFFILLCFACSIATAQTGKGEKDNKETNPADSLGIDAKDIWHSVFKKHKSQSTALKKFQTVVIPGIGYSLQTGWAGAVGISSTFSNSNLPGQKASNILAVPTYTQKSQTIIPITANIWSKNNKYNFITDFRYVTYPSSIYGLGGRVDPTIGFNINYHSIKFHQSIQKEFAKNFYLGVGYYYDQYWDITVLDSLKRNIVARLAHKLGTNETASGLAVKALYDSRLNQVNPQQGIYANVVFRKNLTVLGSDANWNSLLIDTRAYLPFPAGSKNILAFWNYDLLTIGNNKPPYLMLPSTGWDDYYNTGRGYVQGRFRGKNMYYAETEYRVRLTPNDLLHGVAFFNVESFSGDLSKSNKSLLPGYGIGLRFKLNKFSNTNMCLDYGFGKNGSRGFFVNLGEVF